MTKIIFENNGYPNPIIVVMAIGWASAILILNAKRKRQWKQETEYLNREQTYPTKIEYIKYNSDPAGNDGLQIMKGSDK